MKKDSSAKKVKSALRQSGVRPSKQRGQNFLVDQSVLASIIEFAEPSAEDRIVEIGPGTGALTELLPPGADLTLIEIEPEFCRLLSEKFPSAKVINQDVRQVDFKKLGKDLVVFGNLPYVYSTDIIFTLIENRNSIKRGIFLLQQEFARRMAAAPGGRDYGILTISVQMHANLKLGPVVPGTAFIPSTKVTSQVIEVEFLAEPRYEFSDMALFRKVVQSSFAQRRKKLSNSLRSTGFFTREQIEKALNIAEIDGSRRAETLSILEFVNLSAAIQGLENKK